MVLYITDVTKKTDSEGGYDIEALAVTSSCQYRWVYGLKGVLNNGSRQLNLCEVIEYRQPKQPGAMTMPQSTVFLPTGFYAELADDNNTLFCNLASTIPTALQRVENDRELEQSLFLTLQKAYF